MRKFIHSLIAIIFFISCSEREWKNIYDPEGSNPSEWAPQTFIAQQISDRTVRLVWEQFDERIDGFHLNRKTGNQEMVEKFRSFDPDLRTWIDTITHIGEKQTYELYAFADQAVSAKMAIEFNPVFEGPEITDMTHISSSVIKLEWDVHPYPTVSMYYIERSENGGDFQLFKQTDAIMAYDSTLNQSDTYAYRVKAVTDLNISDPGGETGIRWDHIGYTEHWNNFLPYYHGEPAPDGLTIAAWKQDDLSLFDSETGTQLWSVDPGMYYPGTVIFSSDNSLIISLTRERFFKVWNSSNGQELWTGEHQNIANNRVIAADISPDATKIASGDHHNQDQEAEIRVWNALDGSILWTQTMLRSIGAIAFSPDNMKLATGDLAGNVSLWNVSDGNHIRTDTYPSTVINSLHFSHDNSKLVICTEKNDTQEYHFYVTTVNNGSVVFSNGHGWSVQSIDFTHDDSYLMTSSHDDTLKVWNTSTGALIYTKYGGPPAWFSPDESKIIAGGDAGLRVYNTSDGSLFWQVNTLGYSWNVKFVGDGFRLLSSSETGLMVWTENYGWKIIDHEH